MIAAFLCGLTVGLLLTGITSTAGAGYRDTGKMPDIRRRA